MGEEADPSVCGAWMHGQGEENCPKTGALGGAKTHSLLTASRTVARHLPRAGSQLWAGAGFCWLLGHICSVFRNFGS